MKDICKATLWGLSTLVALVYLVFMFSLAYLSLNEHSQLTTKKINVLISKITPVVNSLAVRFPGEENEKTFVGWDRHPEADEANRQIDRITREIVPGAIYYHSGDFYELYSPDNKLKLIQSYMVEPSKIMTYNFYNIWIRVLASLIGFFLGAIFFYRLMKRKRFDIKSNLFFMMIAAPIFITASSISLIYSDLSLSLWNFNQAFTCFIVSVVWVFLVYPAIFVLAKKQSGMKAILFP